jgi:hypothetical protein
MLTLDYGETWDVMPERNIQDEPAGLSIGLIMLPQAAPDFAGLNAHERILAGIEGRPFSERLSGYQKLVNFLSPVLKVIIANQFQEALQFGSAAELRGLKDALDFSFPFLDGRRALSNTSSRISWLS